MAIIRLISMNHEKDYSEDDDLEYKQLQSPSSSSSDTTSTESNSNHGTLLWKKSTHPRGKARQYSQVLALIPVYLLQICYGMNTGFPAILTPQLRENCSEFSITSDQESWIVSIDNLATPLICILSGFLQQKFGPQRVLMFACLPYTLGWVTTSLAKSVYVLYLSRLFVGISHALLTTTVYTVEISSKEMRGTYSLLESVLRCFGCLLIYALGFGLRWHQIAIFAPIVPILAFISAITLAPESPVYLLAKRRTEEAHEALSKLYGPNYHITEELEIIQDNLKKLRDSRGRKITYLKELNRHPEIYKPFLIIVILSIIQQFSGMSILRAYVVKIFNDVFHRTSLTKNFQNSTTTLLNNCTKHSGDGSTSSEAYISAIIIGFVRLLASLLLSKLLREFPRRAMYFTSATMTIISLISFAVCTYFIDRSITYQWGALVTACCLVFSVQLGIQTLPNLLSGELFPSDVRAFCKSLTRSATCGFLVIGLKLYPIFEQYLTIPGTFLFFSAILIFCLPIVYWILPETKDLGLEMIQSYFIPSKTVFYVDLPLGDEKNKNSNKTDICITNNTDYGSTFV